MKFMTKIHNPKAHPLSKRMVELIIEILVRHGIENKDTLAKCSLELFRLTLINAREIQSFEAKERNTDKLLAEHSSKYKSVLAKYGIEDENEKEQIILEFIEGVGSIGD